MVKPNKNQYRPSVKLSDKKSRDQLDYSKPSMSFYPHRNFNFSYRE